MPSDTHTLVVLIDGDSVKPEYLGRVLAWAAKDRTVKIRRIYGDRSKLSDWEECISNHGIEPMINDGSHKNAADMMMAADAVEIYCHGSDVDGFCIVTQDNDFAGLVKWLRRKGAYVAAIWSSDHNNHEPSFKAECNDFMLVDELPGLDNPDPTAQKKLSGWKDAVREAIKTSAVKDGWVLLSDVGNRLKSARRDFEPRNFCHSKLFSLIDSCGEFEAQTDPERVRIRPQT